MTVVPIKQAPADPRPMPASADAEGVLWAVKRGETQCNAAKQDTK